MGALVVPIHTPTDTLPLPEDSKRVEFRGLPSVFSDPEVQRRLRYRQIRPEGKAALWRLEQQRQMQGFARFSGRTKRILGPADGLSREYVWGPREYTILMDPADIRILMSWGRDYQRAFVVQDDLIVLGRKRNNRPTAGEDRNHGRYPTV